VLNIREVGLLKSILKHCNKIQIKISTLTREQFDKDEDIREIICFNIFQIGELAKNLSPEFVRQYGGVPWKQIKGMRDKIGHGYGTIDLDRIWDTALLDIPPLKAYCENILNN
jgi:uncharacterized protein with HEPN domain